MGRDGSELPPSQYILETSSLRTEKASHYPGSHAVCLYVGVVSRAEYSV